jgi:hypothetical protein
LEDPNYYVYDGKIYYELPAKFKWSLTHLDGPMTAIISYQGKNYYGKCHQSPEARGDRFFWLYPLKPTEFLKELAYQEWFREYFGVHCDYDENMQRCSNPRTWRERWFGWTRPAKKTCSYSEKRKELRIDREEYLKREAIGYCTLWSWKEHQISLRDKS